MTKSKLIKVILIGKIVGAIITFVLGIICLIFFVNTMKNTTQLRNLEAPTPENSPYSEQIAQRDSEFNALVAQGEEFEERYNGAREFINEQFEALQP